jgi:argonaute-like protein implicated in RNA metabolism and viral defense
VKLEDYKALLWVHGVTKAVRAGWKYFKGKRRIPAPTVLCRHSGQSDLGMLAGEILGLSKMDWNSADMYSKLPATVNSSKQIARLGMLLERFGPLSYDYRLFI